MKDIVNDVLIDERVFNIAHFQNWLMPSQYYDGFVLKTKLKFNLYTNKQIQKRKMNDKSLT